MRESVGRHTDRTKGPKLLNDLKTVLDRGDNPCTVDDHISLVTVSIFQYLFTRRLVLAVKALHRAVLFR